MTPTRSTDTVARAILAGLPSALTVGLNRRHAPVNMPWSPFSLANGNAGLAMTYGVAEQWLGEDAYAQQSHAHMRVAIGALAHTDLDQVPVSLFTGLTALASAAHFAAMGKARYTRVLTDLHVHLLAKFDVLLSYISQHQALSEQHYDVVSGATGVGGYLLSAADTYPDLEDAVRRVLTTLVGRVERSGDAAFATDFRFAAPRQRDQPERYSAGSINVGLAHGIPGPLALLSLAKLHGRCVAGQDEAIMHLVRQVLGTVQSTQWGPDVPYDVPVALGAPVVPTRSRTAWCYGAPGVARALQLAAQALGDPPTEARAVELMLSVARRPDEERIVPSPTLCHGLAGLVLQLHLFNRDLQRPPALLKREEVRLRRALLDAYDSHHPLGYLDMTLEDDGTCARHEDPGLLQGAAGVALALMTLDRPAPHWTRVLLLA